MDLSTVVDWAQILALPVAIIAIIVSVVLFRRSRQRRALACEFQSIAFPIEIKAGEAYGGDIEIRYQGKPIANLFVVRVRLKNTGNVPIRESEIVKPVTFEFDPNTTLVQPPKFVDKKPEDLNTYWTYLGTVGDMDYEGETAPLAFDLFNAGDEVTAEFLCTGKVALPTVTARIEGITELGVLDLEQMKLREDLAMRRFSIVGLNVLLFFCVTILMAGRWEDDKPIQSVLYLAALLVFIVIIIGATEFVIPSALHRRRKRKREGQA